MRRVLLCVVLLFMVALAGCLTDGGLTGTRSDDSPAMRMMDADPIGYDLQEAVDWWEAFATDYPKHDANTPTNQLAREFLVSEMEDLGYDVEVRSYAPGALGTDAPADPGQPLLQYHAVVATKPGVKHPDERIGLVSHYDTQSATIMGAYDDASGVAVQRTICKALADVPLDHTLACIFFDAEERGLVASDRYVDDVILEGDEPYVYDFVIGYDMTGINWPGHEWKLYLMTGNVSHSLALQPFGQELMHDVMDYPESGVEVLDVHDRNSDERRFKEAGVPIFRFAGGRNAADYPAYHMPHDLVQYVDQFVGGRANFEAGFQTVVDASLVTVQALDGTTIDELHEWYA